VSPDGSTVAYAASVNREIFLKAGERKTSIASKPDMIFLSPNGRDAGWVERLPLPDGGSKMRVVAFGKAGESFGLVGIPVISPTEPLVAYGRRGKRFCCHRGEKDRNSGPDPRDGLGPDGRQVGYGARSAASSEWKVLAIP
jgi:hypothetical protein